MKYESNVDSSNVEIEIEWGWSWWLWWHTPLPASIEYWEKQ